MFRHLDARLRTERKRYCYEPPDQDESYGDPNSYDGVTHTLTLTLTHTSP